MKIRFIAASCAILSAFAIPAFPDATEEVLPAGSRAQVRLVDYINTDHQPLGYTVRGIVEGDIRGGDKIVVPDKSKVLMRLVSEPLPSTSVTVEWWAIKFGDDWSEFRSAPGAGGLFTTLKNVEDRRPPKPEAKPLVSRGPALHIPFNSILHFESRHLIRLVNVGRYRP